MKKKTYTILIQDTAEYEVEAVSEVDALAIFERQAPNPAECLEEFGELSYEVVSDNEDDESQSPPPAECLEEFGDFSVKVVSANEDEDEWAPERGSIIPKDY